MKTEEEIKEKIKFFKSMIPRLQKRGFDDAIKTYLWGISLLKWILEEECTNESINNNKCS